MQKGMETIMLKQVAIFAENKKGTFQDITQILQNANINIDRIRHGKGSRLPERGWLSLPFQ